MTIKINGTNTTAQPSITGADTDTGLVYGTDQVQVVTGGTTRATVDSSGNLGLGTSSPSNLLHVKRTTSGNTYAIIENTTSGNAGINIKNANGSWTLIANDALRFIDDDSSAERMRILSSGGITFNGDTAAANALDDYEEGTWTPVIATEGGTPYTLGSTYARYVKVGKLVYVAFDLQFTAIGSGTITIISLPFSRASGEASIINGHVTSGNNRQSIQYSNYISNYLLVRLDDGGSQINYWTAKSNWAATNAFIGTGVYETA